MPTPVPSTSVVIVSHRPGEWLASCLVSVTDQAEQVVVVDNGSEGRLASRLGREAGAEVVALRRNTGFTGGVTAGLSQCRGDLVGVLNDDAVASPDWLSSAATRLAVPGVAAVTPKVRLPGKWAEIVVPTEEWFVPGDARPLGQLLASVTVDGREVLDQLVGAGVHGYEHPDGQAPFRWTKGRRLPFYVPLGDAEDAPVALNGEPVIPNAVVKVVNHAGSWLGGHGGAGERGMGAPDDGRFDAEHEPFGFSATAPVFRRDALEDVGGLASHFFAYNEDTDWCLRARLLGWSIAYDPTATIDHRLSATSRGTTAPLVRLLSRRNALLCLVRTAPPERIVPHLSRAWMDRRDDEGLSRSVGRHLPWALATRASLRRRWRLDPRDVWDRWEADGGDWERGPARTHGPAGPGSPT